MADQDRSFDVNADEQGQLLRRQIAEMPIGHILWDRQFRVRSWNPAAERMFGYTAQEALGQHASFIVPPSDRGHVDGVWQRLIAGERTAHSTNENITKDGRTIRCQWTNTPLTGPAGAVFGAFSLVLDVTRQVELERQLANAEKMHAVALLTAGVAHDFNNLLTVIIGSTELALSMLPPESRSRELIEHARLAGQRGAELTGRLLVFSRQQVVAPEVIDVAAFIRDSLPLIRSLVSERIRLETVCDPDCGSVNCDRSALQQILLNLTANARDAMREGGTITVTARAAVLGMDGQSPCPPGQYVELTVGDTGRGMDPGTLARVFEPFFTTKPPGRGSGLGLAIVASLVDRHGGSLRLTSAPDAGTTVRILLPTADAPESPLAPDVISGPMGHETVLVMDDNDLVRAVMADALRFAGYDVLQAASGSEGIRVAQSFDGPIHLLLADLVMTDMNGRHVAREIRRLRPSTRVLYVSGYAGDSLESSGVSLPLDAPFLQKPFSPAALATTVRGVLDVGRN